MAFSVFMYAIGGYAVAFLVAMLVLERVREPVRQSAPRSGRVRAQLSTWPRTARRCPVTNEAVLPLRTARLAAPPRRRRPAQTSCRAVSAARSRRTGGF